MNDLNDPNDLEPEDLLVPLEDEAPEPSGWRLSRLTWQHVLVILVFLFTLLIVILALIAPYLGDQDMGFYENIIDNL